MAYCQETNREKNGPLLLGGVGKLPGIEIALQEGPPVFSKPIKAVGRSFKKSCLGQLPAPHSDVLVIPINIVRNVLRSGSTGVSQIFHDEIIRWFHPLSTFPHYALQYCLYDGKSYRLVIIKSLLACFYNKLVVKLYLEGRFIHSPLNVEAGTTYGSGRPKARKTLRGISHGESCEPVLGPPARGGSAGISSETMSNHDSTGLQSREPDDASTDEDILIGGDGSEILTDGGQQATPFPSTAMQSSETQKEIRVECWECECEFFISMDERGVFDRCPYCGNTEGLDVQGRTFEVKA